MGKVGRPKKNQTATIEADPQEPTVLESDEDLSRAEWESLTTLDRLIETLPEDSQAYAKIYWRDPEKNRLQIVDHLELHNGIDDLELELCRRAAKKEWPQGDYQIQCYMKGHKGLIARPQSVLIDPSKFTSTVFGNGHSLEHQEAPQVTAKEQIKETVEMATMMRAAFGANQGDPGAITAAISTALKAGVDAARPAGNGNSDMQTQIMTALLQNAFNKKDGILEQIITAREAGLIPENKTQDQSLIDQITAITTIMDKLGGLGGGAEKTSPITEIIRTVGPQAGSIVSNFTGMVSKILDYQAARLRGEVPQPTVTHSPTVDHPGALAQPQSLPPGSPPTQVNPPQTAPPAPNQEDQMILNLLQRIGTEAQTKNYDYFPGLYVELASSSFFADYIKQHADGTLMDEQALEMIVNQYPPFGEEIVKEYIVAFLHWHTFNIKQGTLPSVSMDAGINTVAEAPPVETNPQLTGLVAQCEKCNTQFQFDNIDDFTQDSKVCDENVEGNKCLGEIKLLSEDTQDGQVPADPRGDIGQTI